MKNASKLGTLIMKYDDDTLKIISKNISDIMNKKKHLSTPKDLSDKSGLSYSTLTPILKGERDFRVSNLLSLTEVLNTTPNELLKGCFKNPAIEKKSAVAIYKPKYFFSFVTNAEITHCKIYNTQTKKTQIKISPFSLSCGEDTSDIIEKIKSSIVNLTGDNAPLDQTSLYLSVLAYEHINGREKIVDYFSKKFGYFIIEPDWLCLHKAILSNLNGILVTINNGFVLSYSHDKGQTIRKLQGYSFPISDEAGNYWLGCKAIKHTIRVAEGTEKKSLLSDKILSLVNSDLNLLATKVYDNHREIYAIAASTVKELAYQKDKAHDIIKEGFDNIWQHIKQIDGKLKDELPIYLAGDLAYLYEEFIPKKRLVKIHFDNILDLQFKYSMQLLSSTIPKI